MLCSALRSARAGSGAASELLQAGRQQGLRALQRHLRGTHHAPLFEVCIRSKSASAVAGTACCTGAGRQVESRRIGMRPAQTLARALTRCAPEPSRRKSRMRCATVPVPATDSEPAQRVAARHVP